MFVAIILVSVCLLALFVIYKVLTNYPTDDDGNSGMLGVLNKIKDACCRTQK